MTLQSIRDIQGNGLYSPLAGESVETQGIVTGLLRKGFYIQTPKVQWDGERSDAIFVFGDSSVVKLGYWVQVGGECVDYLKHDTARPVTQIKMNRLFLVEEKGPDIQPIVLSEKLLPRDYVRLGKILNSLEGMLVELPTDATFIAPSNAFGDYVCALPHHFSEPDIIPTNEGGLIVEGNAHERWFPGFRIWDYKFAPRLNVGAKLTQAIEGPLHYRVDAWQMAVSDTIEFDDNPIVLQKSRLQCERGALTVLTLNGFNLDWHVESEARVANPRQDVDDDWGEGRFHTLAQAIVLQANTPDIVALQEIQDNDGAELSAEVNASKTYTALIHLVKVLSGVAYRWADIPPKVDADGGQPGGNIRNGFLYNPERVDLVEGSLCRLGEQTTCFEDSRKPLVASFRERHSQNELTIINVHLVSKRQQTSLFAPVQPGVDVRESVRVEQASIIARHTDALYNQDQRYYVTGDFNDHEHSRTLKTLTGERNANLVFNLPPQERFDYNHRGKLQVLMHGIVPKTLVLNQKADYDIIHGNELVGVPPGAESDKPSDHAYVLAKIHLV